MNKDLIIPLPPGMHEGDFEGKSKAAVGFYPCINKDRDCTEYLLVKIDNHGKPYANCKRGEITARGCTRSVKGIQSDVPDQTFESYEKAVAYVSGEWPMPDVVARYLDEAWRSYIRSTSEAPAERAESGSEAHE